MKLLKMYKNKGKRLGCYLKNIHGLQSNLALVPVLLVLTIVCIMCTGRPKAPGAGMVIANLQMHPKQKKIHQL